MFETFTHLFAGQLFRQKFYLDPGSGSFLLQLLIAGLLGAGFVIKSSWGKIKSFMNRNSKNLPAEEQDESIEESYNE